MTDKTIGQIQQHYGSAGAEILTRYHDTLDEIKEDRDLEPGAYLDRLNDHQRLELLREQKSRQVDEARARTIDEYREHLQRAHAELEERASKLRDRLYKVENTTALSNAATADEEGLSAMLDIATHAGDKTLTRAVLVAAENRSLGDLVGRYFDEVDPDARELYNEWRQVPPAEVLERQVQSVEQLVHRPSVDSLMPSPRVSTY
jgi:hypothetical protein